MTRKRFIKIMQRKGMQRNEATLLAEEVRKIKFAFGSSPYEVFSYAGVTRLSSRRFVLTLTNRYAWISYWMLSDRSQQVEYAGGEGYKWWARSPVAISNPFTMPGVALTFCY